MSEIVNSERVPPLPMTLENQSAQLLSVIAKAATDPTVDIDKMERLFAMSEQLRARNAEAEFNRAMSEAQAQMGRVSANQHNSQTRSRYADYAALDRMLRPIYTTHGFALSFNSGASRDAETLHVECVVSHREGHSRTYHIDMPADGKGAKGGDVMTKTHATGAAASYGMRYLLKMIFNVAIGEDDNDGNEPDRITDAHAAEIKRLLEETGSDVRAFLKWVASDSVDAMPESRYEAAKRMLLRKTEARA